MVQAASKSFAGVGSLVLAPHPDDAAVSLGGAILGRHLPMPITVATLFGRSNYAGGRFHPDANRVTTLRRAEDENWAREAGVHLIFLDRPEASLRIGSSFAHVFSSPEFNHPAAGEVAEIINAYIKTENPRLLLAPLGIGGHYDHIVVRELAMDLAQGASMVTGFYEDLPYAYHASREEIAQALSDLLPCPHPLVLPLRPGELDAKCESLSFYASQMEDALVQAVRGHSLAFGHDHGAERLWFSAADSRYARTLA